MAYGGAELRPSTEATKHPLISVFSPTTLPRMQANRSLFRSLLSRAYTVSLNYSVAHGGCQKSNTTLLPLPAPEARLLLGRVIEGREVDRCNDLSTVVQFLSRCRSLGKTTRMSGCLPSAPLAPRHEESAYLARQVGACPKRERAAFLSTTQHHVLKTR